MIQRKGLSGTSIWSKTKPIREIKPMSLSVSEGRITAVEFKNLIVVTVYTPNSQGPGTDRCLYRTCIWDQQFREWVNELNMLKPTVETKYRIKKWCEYGSGPNASWVFKAAQDATEFFETYRHNPEELFKSYELEWLNDYFASRYKS